MKKIRTKIAFDSFSEPLYRPSCKKTTTFDSKKSLSYETSTSTIPVQAEIKKQRLTTQCFLHQCLFGQYSGSIPGLATVFAGLEEFYSSPFISKLCPYEFASMVADKGEFLQFCLQQGVDHVNTVDLLLRKFYRPLSDAFRAREKVVKLR